MKRQADEMTDDGLIVAFEQAAEFYGQTHDLGNPKLANRAHDKVEMLYKQLQDRGTAAMEPLVKLLAAENLWVRYAAAAYAIDFIPERAEPVLVELADSPNALGMMAFTTLSNWKLRKQQAVN